MSTAFPVDDLDDVRADADARLRRLVIKLNNLADRAQAWADKQERDRDPERH